jgi:hypothetical protein
MVSVFGVRAWESCVELNTVLKLSIKIRKNSNSKDFPKIAVYWFNSSYSSLDFYEQHTIMNTIKIITRLFESSKLDIIYALVLLSYTIRIPFYINGYRHE